MRTTVDIPDAKYRLLKSRAASEGTTVKAMVMRGVDVVLSEARVRRAAHLRSVARRGSAVDAVVVVAAEPGGTVYGGDAKDLGALAALADNVAIEPA